MSQPAENTRSLVIERELPHPPQKIWRALTQGALIAEWLMQNDFQPVVGHRFNFRAPPMPHWNGVVDCEVLEMEASRRLAYTWNADGGLRTTVTWTLTPTPRGTLLRLEQAGFRAEQDNNYRGAQYGWQKYLASLEQVVGGLT
jgi:uncharacterized protein YndB with AHSA1/START domain